MIFCGFTITFSYRLQLPLSLQKQRAVTPFFLLCLPGPCTSTCTSLAFWLRSPCIKHTNPGKPVPPLKPLPPPLPPLHAQCSASLFTPTIMTKWTEPLHPTSPFNFQALSVHGVLSKTSEYPLRGFSQLEYIYVLCVIYLFSDRTE